MHEMLFEDVGGSPVARLPHRRDGTKRDPDNAKIFTIDQAAVHWPFMSRQELLDEWQTALGDVAALVAKAEDVIESGEPAEKLPAIPQAVQGEAPKNDLLRMVMYPQLLPEEFDVFLEICRQRSINPWLRRVIPKVEKGQSGEREIVYVTAVEHLRLIAERTGRYAGQEAPQWCGDDGHWMEFWPHKHAPAGARVGVLKVGFGKACWGVVRFDELAQFDERGELQEHWAKMPAGQLAKCAEVAALRKAFPEECGGLYVREELQRRQAPPATLAAAAAADPRRDLPGDRPEPALRYVDDDEDGMPKTERHFRTTMIDLVGSRRVDAVIQGFRREFGPGVSGAAFYARCVRAVRDNPQLYGDTAA